MQKYDGHPYWKGVRHFFAREESESRLWLAVATSVVGQLRAVALHCGRSCGVGLGLKTGPSQRMQKYDGHPKALSNLTYQNICANINNRHNTAQTGAPTAVWVEPNCRCRRQCVQLISVQCCEDQPGCHIAQPGFHIRGDWRYVQPVAE